MKDSDAKFKEWWEVAQEYFAKELQKNLAHKRDDEGNLKYKWEIYQRNFLDFIYGSPTSIEALGQDEETKTGPNEIVSKEEVQTQEPQDFKGGGKDEKEPQIV